MTFDKRERLNIRTIVRLLGLLLIIESAFMAVGLIVSLIYDEPLAVRSFIYSIAITLVAGCILAFAIRSKNNDMGKREGFLITSLTWVFFSFFGMLPYFFGDGHTQLSVDAAFMETMSGFTTTGISAITDVESTSHGLLMWRAITHFIGGMGIILFTLAVIPMLNKKSGIQLFNAEVTGITHDKVRPRISHTAKSLWIIYLILNAALIVCLWLGPMDLFDAICHAFASISTGGFSTKNASIMAYNSDYVELIISFFMFLSAINFALLYKAAYGDFKSLYKNDTFRWYCGLIVAGYLIIVATLYLTGNYDSMSSLFVAPLFQTVSAITSTGFIGADFNTWHAVAVLVLTFLMFVGACAGSTTGGVKVDRIVMIVKNLKNELYKILYPNTILPVRVNGKVLSSDLSSKVFAFLVLFFILIIIGTLLISATGLSIFDAFFAVVSCIGNNGLGYGFTGVSYAEISCFGKWVLSVLMLIGRLEVFTVIVLFTKAFWLKE